MAEKEKLIEMYRKMVTIRRFEERVSDLYSKGFIPGFVHVYIGEEAVAVGVCSVLKRDDYITSTHRGHGHCIVKVIMPKPGLTMEKGTIVKWLKREGEHIDEGGRLVEITTDKVTYKWERLTLV